jgi:hypothetical protein
MLSKVMIVCQQEIMIMIGKVTVEETQFSPVALFLSCHHLVTVGL